MTGTLPLKGTPVSSRTNRLRFHVQFSVCKCDGRQVSLDGVAEKAEVAASAETMVLLGFPKLALDLVSLVQAGFVPRTGHLYQGCALSSNQTCLWGSFF